ncbi:MAG: hypothetical protein ACPG8W_14185 [Candidatus Promineifilaceae bacterium]
MIEVNWQQEVRKAFQQYHSLQRLSRSSLVVGKLGEGVTWTGDKPVLYGYAVRGTLQWALRLLGNGNHFERQSAETLRLRYVERLTASACAARLHLVVGAIKTRQPVAIERTANLLAEAATHGTGLDGRQQLAVAARYAACSADLLPQLHFWSIFHDPVVPEMAQALDTPLQPHFSELLALNWIVSSADGRVHVHPQGVAHVRQLLEAKERQRYHTIAAEFYERKALFESAIYHWQQSHQDNRAATLLFEQQAMFTSITLNRLLDGFERERLSAEHQAQCQLLKGRVLASMQDLDSAIDAFEQALQTSNQLTLALACYEIAKLYESREVAIALDYYRRSRTYVMNCVGEMAERLQVRILIDEAWVFINQKSDFVQAEQNLMAAEAPRWDDLRIDLDSAWGELYMRQAKLEHCLDARWRAWIKANETQDTRRMLRVGHNLADTLAYAQQLNEAWRMAEKVEKLAVEAGDSHVAARCRKTLGNVCVNRKQNAAAAISYYQRAYTYFSNAKDLHWQGAMCYDLAEAHLMNSDPVKAYEFIEKGRNIAHELGNKRLEQALQAIINTSVALTADLSARQRTIIWEVAQNGEIRTKRCMALTGLERRQAVRELQTLETMKLLQKVGKGRGTRYV